MSKGRAWPSLMAALLLSLSTACAHAGRGTRLHLSINVAADANDNRPIPVDLVIVWDKKKAAQFGELAAKDWSRAGALRRDDPTARRSPSANGSGSRTIRAGDRSPCRRAVRWVRAVYVFANYRFEGLHRLSVTPGTAATLHLLRQTIQLQSDSANQRHTGAP